MNGDIQTTRKHRAAAPSARSPHYIEEARQPKFRGQILADLGGEWGRITAACRITGLKRARIYQILTDEPNAFETFVLKRRPDAKSGARLFNLESVRRYMRQRCTESTMTK